MRITSLKTTKKWYVLVIFDPCGKSGCRLDCRLASYSRQPQFGIGTEWGPGANGNMAPVCCVDRKESS